MSVKPGKVSLNLVDNGEHWKICEQVHVFVKVMPTKTRLAVVLKGIRGREPAAGRDKELTAVFYRHTIFSKLGFAFGIWIPGVMFCSGKHFSLSSGVDLNSLDVAGSCEGVSLPGGDQMKGHL